MHNSSFRYNITRPYPFRWFTPATIIGSLIALVAFSLLNLSTTGYDIVTIYTPDPNKTLSSNLPVFSWSLQGSSHSECQENIIPAYSQVQTNNSALTYRISSAQKLSQEDSDLLFNFPSPSFNYMNTVLENCTLNFIALDLESYDRPAIERSRTEWGAAIAASTTCLTNTAQGRVELQLTAVYDVGTTSPTIVPSVPWLGRNSTTKSSLYWGETLMDLLWRALVYDAAQSMQQGDQIWYKGFVQLSPSQPTTPVTSDAFFTVASCFFYAWPDANGNISESFCQDNNAPSSFSRLLNNQTQPAGGGLQIWNSLDLLAKTFYSVIMVDLGQQTPIPNLLVDSALLQHYTANISQLGNLPLNLPIATGLATEPFDPSNHSAGYPQNLGIQLSIILSEYICQQKKWKPIGALITSTLVANVVFLTASWKLFTWIVSAYIVRPRPGANFCAGCLQSAQDIQGGSDEEQDVGQVVALVATKASSESKRRLIAWPVSTADEVDSVTRPSKHVVFSNQSRNVM